MLVNQTTRAKGHEYAPTALGQEITACYRVSTWSELYKFHQRAITQLTHYQTTILDSSKLKEFADDNFKFDENDRKLSKQVENTVGKGKIARYEQFLLCPQCFQRLVS